MRRPSVLPCRSFVRPPVQLCPPPRAEPFPLPPPPPSRAAALSSHTPQPCPLPRFTAFPLRRNPSYQEADGQRVMQESEITIKIDLGRGTASQTLWTCDLSHDYVSINADYRS